jgi:glycosyltransferase involved in cell wall biosynthesis
MINCIGQMFDTTGYAIHFRNLVNALSKIEEVRISAPLVPNWNRMVSDKELELLKRKPVKDEINLIVTNPMYWRLNCGKGRNWAFLVWEGDRIPKCYIEECLNKDIEYIFVPSKHTWNAVEKSTDKAEILNKLKVIPHGVDLSLFYSSEKPSKHTFLINKGWRNLEDRGGTQYAVKAYLEEFTDKDNVELLLKINPVYGVPDLNKMIEQLAPKKENLPKILIDITSYDYKELVKLYNKGNVFVATSRAEAYHLGCIEAMACGLPIITTNFGGQTDFVNEDNGWLIGGNLEEVKHEIQYESISWLTPSIDEIRKAMRESYENKEITQLKANASILRASKETWDRTANLISQCKHEQGF